MKKAEFTFNFIHDGNLFPAHCYVFLQEGATEFPYSGRMYRVSMVKETTKPEVFLFYDLPQNPFFYYKSNSDRKDAIYVSIHTALQRIGSLPQLLEPI